VRLLSLLYVLLLCGCSGHHSEPASPSSLHHAISEEHELSANKPTTDTILKARDASVTYMKTHLPDWDIKGIGMSSDSANGFAAAVDASKGKERRTFYISSRLFVTNEAKMYWKVDQYISHDGEHTSPYLIVTFQAHNVEPPSDSNDDRPDQ
jgi:hypothetical protein